MGAVPLAFDVHVVQLTQRGVDVTAAEVSLRVLWALPGGVSSRRGCGGVNATRVIGTMVSNKTSCPVHGVYAPCADLGALCSTAATTAAGLLHRFVEYCLDNVPPAR